MCSLSVCLSGEDISLSVSQVLSCRRFCNKMWQTVRFTLGVLEERGAELRTLDQVLMIPVMNLPSYDPDYVEIETVCGGGGVRKKAGTVTNGPRP